MNTRIYNPLFHSDLLFRLSKWYNVEKTNAKITNDFVDDILREKKITYQNNKLNKKSEAEEDVGEGASFKKPQVFIDQLLKLSMEGNFFTDQEVKDEANTIVATVGRIVPFTAAAVAAPGGSCSYYCCRPSPPSPCYCHNTTNYFDSESTNQPTIHPSAVPRSPYTGLREHGTYHVLLPADVGHLPRDAGQVLRGDPQRVAEQGGRAQLRRPQQAGLRGAVLEGDYATVPHSARGGQESRYQLQSKR